MKEHNFKLAPMTKRMLLNASQRKYLTDRINKHYWKLKKSVSEESEEPAEVLAARKLIDEWERKSAAEEKAREAGIEDALKSHVKKITEALLF